MSRKTPIGRFLEATLAGLYCGVWSAAVPRHSHEMDLDLAYIIFKPDPQEIDPSGTSKVPYPLGELR